MSLDAQVQRAFEEAAAISKANPGCGTHVNAVVRLDQGRAVISRIYTSDWYSSDSTIATFVDGKQCDN